MAVRKEDINMTRFNIYDKVTKVSEKNQMHYIKQYAKAGYPIYANAYNDGIVIYSTFVKGVVIIIGYTTINNREYTLSELHVLNHSGYIGNIYLDAEGIA